MKKLIRREKMFYGDNSSNNASSFYRKQLKNKKAHNVDMAFDDEYNSFVVSWEENKNFVYILHYEPYGWLEKFTDEENIRNVYSNPNTALKKAKSVIYSMIHKDDFVARPNDLEEFRSGESKSITLYWEDTKSHDYCILSIIEKEVE